MPQFTPDALISRHVEKLIAQSGRERAEELLRRCELVLTGTRVINLHGPITDETCYRYKQHVRLLYGDAAYAFAKVNFMLGGCGCMDCGAK